jgi:hypothetical protein
MKRAARKLVSIRPSLVCLLFGTALAGCAAQEAKSTAPAADESEAPTAAAPPPPAEASGGAERDEEAPAQQAAPSSVEGRPAPEAEKKSSAHDDAVKRLSVETGQFERAMQPEQLSCGAAKPLRDAICEIATRICDLSTNSPSSTNSGADCNTAKSSCLDAQRKYKERCEK